MGAPHRSRSGDDSDAIYLYYVVLASRLVEFCFGPGTPHRSRSDDDSGAICRLVESFFGPGTPHRSRSDDDSDAICRLIELELPRYPFHFTTPQ